MGLGGLVFCALLVCNYFKVKFGIIQIILGFALWFAFLQAGVEASITGVLFAFAVPVKDLSIIEKAIHRPVNFIILPLFALANTAILMPSNVAQALSSKIGLGVALGLIVGKPVGIFLVSRIMVGLKIAKLPGNIQWKQILGMGMLAGIGFTMSIFTTMLAFPDPAFMDISKISILFAMVSSVALSWFYFNAIDSPVRVPNVITPIVQEPSIEQIFEPVLQRLSLFASAQG